jgi:hypothetical protein
VIPDSAHWDKKPAKVLQNAYLWTYPLRPQVTYLSGVDNLLKYQFGTMMAGHTTCKTCGVSMFNFLHERAPFAPVNTRTTDGVDVYQLERKEQEVEVPLPDGTTVKRVLGNGAKR